MPTGLRLHADRPGPRVAIGVRRGLYMKIAEMSHGSNYGCVTLKTRNRHVRVTKGSRQANEGLLRFQEFMDRMADYHDHVLAGDLSWNGRREMQRASRKSTEDRIGPTLRCPNRSTS